RQRGDNSRHRHLNGGNTADSRYMPSSPTASNGLGTSTGDVASGVEPNLGLRQHNRALGYELTGRSIPRHALWRDPRRERSDMDLSIIVPCYNEERALQPLQEALMNVVPDLADEYE